MRTLYFLFFVVFWLSSLSQEASSEEPVSISLLKKKHSQIKEDACNLSPDTISRRIHKFWSLLDRVKNSAIGTVAETEKQHKEINEVYASSVLTLCTYVFVPESRIDSLTYYHELLKTKNIDPISLVESLKLIAQTKGYLNDLAGTLRSTTEALAYLKEMDHQGARIEEMNILNALLGLYIDYDANAYIKNTILNLELKHEQYLSKYKSEAYFGLYLSVRNLFYGLKSVWLANNGSCEEGLYIMHNLDKKGITEYYRYAMSFYYEDMINLHRMCGNYDSALVYCKIRFSDEFTEFNITEPSEYIYLADIYTATKDLTKAEFYIDLLKEDTTINANIDIYINKTFADFYKAKDNYKLAYTYREKHIHILDSIKNYNSRITGDLNAYSLSLNTKIVQLNAERIITKKTTELYIYLFITIVIALLFIFLNILYVRNKRRDQLNLELKKSKELVASKNNFLENLSHEMRTPITVIVGYLSLLKEHTLEPQKIVYYANKTIRNSEKMLGSLNNFLTALQLEKKSLSLQNKSSKKLNPFLKETISSFEGNALLKRIHIYYTSNVLDAIAIEYDFYNLTKIINNLISNAIKYSPSNSSIYVSVTLEENQINISIKDEGIGIEKEEQKEVFSRFYQSKNNKTTGGFGIGLSLVDQLVKKLEGTIRLESNLTLGSDFKLKLPHKVEHFNLSIKQSKIEVESLIKEKVEQIEQTVNLPKALIVDDNLEMIQYLTELFSNKLNCSFAFSGAEGLEKIKTASFNLIISDLRMPVMDGQEFKSELNKLEHYKDIPFIMITAVAYDQVTDLKMTLGLNDYIVKPFEKDEILSRVRLLLETNINRKNIVANEKEKIELDGSFTKLIEKINITIRENLSNPDFSSTDLAYQCGKSKMQLNKVLQSKIGMTLNTLILEVRLLKAYELIVRNEYSTINEVIYSIGLNSRSYFSKKFKDRFGIKVGDLKKKYSNSPM